MTADAVNHVAPIADDALIAQALRLLDARMRVGSIPLSSPQAVRNYLRLRIAELEREGFVVLFRRLTVGRMPTFWTVDDRLTAKGLGVPGQISEGAVAKAVLTASH